MCRAQSSERLELLPGSKGPAWPEGDLPVTSALLEGTPTSVEKAPCSGHSYHGAKRLLPGPAPKSSTARYNDVVDVLDGLSRDKFLTGMEQTD